MTMGIIKTMHFEIMWMNENGYTFLGPHWNAWHSYLQEAQLSPRDRTMRRDNWNLANCHATVQKLLIRQVLIKSMVWSWRFSRNAMCDRQCALNHDAIQSADIVSSVINKPTTLSFVYHSPVYRRLAVAKYFLSPQCRNCSRDPDHAHLGSTHSSQD